MHISFAVFATLFGVRLPPVTQAALMPVFRRVCHTHFPDAKRKLSAISCGMPFLTGFCGYPDFLALIFHQGTSLFFWFPNCPFAGGFLVKRFDRIELSSSSATSTNYAMGVFMLPFVLTVVFNRSS